MCTELANVVDIGVNPQAVDDELLMFGIASFPSCGHLTYCPHMARRCAIILERLESGTLVPEDFCGFIEADHEPDTT